jgi:hypothetical protein
MKWKRACKDPESIADSTPNERALIYPCFAVATTLQKLAEHSKVARPAVALVYTQFPFPA